MAEIFSSFEDLEGEVINQLSEQRYADSTLQIYRRTYRRICDFMKEKGIDTYSPDVGAKFLEIQNVQESTIRAYKCAVRRLDDCLAGNGYRYHQAGNFREICPEFAATLERFMDNSRKIGNRPATLKHKKYVATRFLNFLVDYGIHETTEIDECTIAKALLTFENKDHYAIVKQLLRVLYEANEIRHDYSAIIPKYKRQIPIPSVYAIDEIRSIEDVIDTSTDVGKRNICIVRLATRMGLRAGDIAKLRISEIDFLSGSIRIIQEKTSSPLTLTMPDEVCKSIYVHLENQRKNHYSDDYVFHETMAPYYRITTSIIRHVINDCMSEAGIEPAGRKHGPHVFRSSLASSMVNDNVSYETVRRILGHTDPNVIVHYAKADIEKLRLCSITPPSPTGRFNDYLTGKKVMNRV